MATLLLVLISLIGILHVWFMILEIFLWETPRGRKTFGTTESFAKESASLAKNQGLYNGFLAAGLFWSLITTDGNQAHSLQCFFLGCVLIAGIYGALTASFRILFIQALPAAIALALILFNQFH